MITLILASLFLTVFARQLQNSPFASTNSTQTIQVKDCGINGVWNATYKLCICNDGWSGDICTMQEVVTVNSTSTIIKEHANVIASSQRKLQRQLFMLAAAVLFLLNLICVLRSLIIACCVEKKEKKKQSEVQTKEVVA